MKIRRYMGKNTQEALLKVKMDLGNDAVILNTRKVRQKGLFKIFSKPMTEVLAAVDDAYGNPKNRETPKVQEKAAEKQAEKAAAPALSIYGGQAEKSRPQTALPAETGDEKLSHLESKMQGMESMLTEIWKQMQAGFAKNQAGTDRSLHGIPKALQIFYGNLVKNEVEADIARKIIEQVSEKVVDGSNINEAASIVYNVIVGVLGRPECIRLREDGKPSVIIFVGPTGVGKTTTIAKIAANIALNHKKNVGFITADTYRIAAVEQLKTYAEILGMPVSVIYSPAEVKDAIAGYSGKDVILIDTAGRSHKNKAQFEELKSLVSASEADEIYLVLSMTTSMKSCREIIQNYDFLSDYKLIFTKLDEAPITGLILNTRHVTGKSLSYVTTGQSVPDDIEVANIDRITKNLLGSIS